MRDIESILLLKQEDRWLSVPRWLGLSNGESQPVSVLVVS